MMILKKLLKDFCDTKYIPNNIEVLELSIDSRELKQGTLFIALPGINNDGRDFITQALELGNNVIAEHPINLNIIETYCNKNSLRFEVQNTLVKCGDCIIVTISNLSEKIYAIANLFYFFDKQYPKLIGVTGTNGKTSVTNFIASILSDNKCRTATIGTIGYGFIGSLIDNKLTTADCVTNNKIINKLIGDGANSICMEVSSHAISQSRVKGLKFETLVFTNLSQDHLDYHKTMNDYYNAKAKLFLEYEYDNAIINVDCDYGLKLYKTLEENNKKLDIDKKIKIITYSTSINQSNIEISTCNSIINPDIKVIEHKITINGMYAKITTPWGSANLNANLLGEFNLSNILAAVAVAAISGVSLEDIALSIENIKPVPGRMNFINKPNKPLVVIDYAHTPDAIYKALDTLNSVKRSNSRLFCVFGCGGDRDKSKRPQMLRAAKKFSDYIIITNDNPRNECADKIIEDILEESKSQENIIINKDRRKAIAVAVSLADVNDIILIAGKGHEEYQIEGNNKTKFSDFQTAECMLL